MTDESTEEVPYLIIFIFCAFGLALLILNILLIAYFIRRRRRKHYKGTVYITLCGFTRQK